MNSCSPDLSRNVSRNYSQGQPAKSGLPKHALPDDLPLEGCEKEFEMYTDMNTIYLYVS